jgi:hypothetical protein
MGGVGQLALQAGEASMCATSIGSTLSHTPVPGERKSGMPEGTEMPAPVSATVEREERNICARRSTSSVRCAAGA